MLLFCGVGWLGFVCLLCLFFVVVAGFFCIVVFWFWFFPIEFKNALKGINNPSWFYFPHHLYFKEEKL